MLVVSILARLLTAVSRPLWYDEIFTVWASRLPWRGLLEALRLDSGPPLFYWMARPFVLAAERLSISDTLARVVSFAAAAGLFVAARSLTEAAARRRALLLSAASPLLLLYAAEARPYALLALEGIGIYLLALRTAERGWRLAGTALLCGAALYTHYLALFLVAAVGAVALARGRWRSAAALACGAVLFLPWVPILVRQPGAATAWLREPFAASFSGFLSALGGVGRIPTPFGGPLPAPLFWAGTAVGLVALAGLAGASPEARDAAAVTLLTLGGALAASVLRPLAFSGRTELAVLPIWLWGLASAGATSRLARAACAAATIAGAAACALLLAAPRGVPFYCAGVEQVRSLVRPGDLLVAGGSFYLPALLAADRGQLSARLVGVPAELEKHPGWIPEALPGAADIARLQSEAGALRPEARTYVLLPAWLATSDLRQALARGRLGRVLIQDSGSVLLVFENH